MKTKISITLGQILILAALTLGLVGCMSETSSNGGLIQMSTADTNTPAAAPAPVPAANPVAGIPPVAQPVIRIKAGSAAPFKDSNGNLWVGDQGFSGGDTIEHPDLTITNTTEPGIYLSEHYGMGSFSWPLPNGKYVVKLHFCETYEGITGPGQRVFSFSVQGKDFKDFDVWVKAGGPYKAYVETVPVEVTDGKLLITFTADVQNPQINGIEIFPQN
jgi:hypothetical protein